MRRPRTKKDAPRKAAWDLMKKNYKLKNLEKTTFYTLTEATVMPTPTSTRSEEREFVVDSGATMHMMSKKELSSGEMDTVKRSRTPTVVLTANGEVHTQEEAQVFVHDLFVTVQLLEETLEDHGYSYGWICGQKPRLTKDEKSNICKTNIFVPLVVPGLSTNPESGSSGATLSQDPLRRKAEQAPRKLVQLASSSSSSSVVERSDELASRRLVPSPEIQNLNKKRDDKKNSKDLLTDLPYWLQDFKDNLKDNCTHPHTVIRNQI